MKILVVDDSEAVRRVTVRFLRRLGFEEYYGSRGWKTGSGDLRRFL